MKMNLWKKIRRLKIIIALDWIWLNLQLDWQAVKNDRRYRNYSYKQQIYYHSSRIKKIKRTMEWIKKAIDYNQKNG